jgi:hypothetical protein
MARRHSAIVLVPLFAILAIATLLGALAIFYSTDGSAALRGGLAVGFCTVVALAFRMLPLRRAILCFLICSVLLLIWYAGIAASNDRAWEPDVAVLPAATVDGDRVAITHIRDFEYRSETAFTPRYYDAVYELSALRSVDMVVSHWSSEAIAHVFLTFGFADGRYLAISIETRRARGRPYSTLAGFFKHYELIYVVGDERDLIGLRTDIRRETVYLYRLQMSDQARRALFLSYIDQISALQKRPQFYNTLTDNCTTGILRNANAVSHQIDYSWKVLASGYADSYAYDIGRLDQSMPFAELKRRSRISRSASDRPDPDFSEQIRQGLVVAQ